MANILGIGSLVAALAIIILVTYYAMEGGNLYDYGEHKRSTFTPKQPKKLSQEDIMRIDAANEAHKHDFNINGTIIRAKDKKTARMIYSRMKGE